MPSKKKPQGPQKEQKKPKSAVRKPTTKRPPAPPPVQPDESTDDPHSDEFIWDDGEYAKLNYAALGKRLAEAGDLFRSPTHGGGLLLMLDDGKHVQITKGADLLPVIVDRVKVSVRKDGNKKSSKIDAAHLNAMLKSQAFLDQFRPVDQISATPIYMPDFCRTQPGFNDGGSGQRIMYVGGRPAVSNKLNTINSSLTSWPSRPTLTGLTPLQPH